MTQWVRGRTCVCIYVGGWGGEANCYQRPYIVEKMHSYVSQPKLLMDCSLFYMS